MRSYGVIAFVFLLMLGCREPFEGFDFQRHNAKLVIEAILTDNDELGYVRVSYTHPIDGDAPGSYLPEDAASVLVTDDQGTEYIFHAQGNGLYSNAGFEATFGNQYRMEVEVNGNRYESDWQQLPEANSAPIDITYRPDTTLSLNELGNPVNQLAITLTDKVIKRAEDSFLYWQFNYFYIYDAYGQPDVLHLLPAAERFCYVQEFAQSDLKIHEDRAIQGLLDTEYNLDVVTVPFGRKMIYDFCVQVIRYNVPELSYQYLNEIERQINRDGGVFDAAPATIVGNFTHISGELDVLGYFGVFNATSQRIFFNQDELPYNKLFLPTSAAACPGHHNVALDNTCFNCTAVASPFNSVTKPAWWR